MIKLVSGLIIVFWAVMTSLYLKQEVLPTIPALAQPSYETFLKNQKVFTDSRMGIYIGQRRLGVTSSQIDKRPDGGYEITNHTDMELLGLPVGKVVMDGYSKINNRYQMESFQFTVKSLLFNREISGHNADGEMVMEISDGKNRQVIRYPRQANATLSNGFSPFVSMPNLAVGKEWTITMINPLDGTVEQGRAFVESLDKMEWEGKTYDVYEVTLDYKGFKPRAWITPDGVILKEELVMPGIYFIREPEKKAK